jgi:hypothetical protein
MSFEISKELADFLNLNYLQNYERISRVKITKLIDSYIETNGLREYRTIKPDEKLKNLLNCGDNEVTFANLQSYIAPHIICVNVAPPPSAPPLSPEIRYAVFPEDELPESPVPPSPSMYAVFPEDELPESPVPPSPSMYAVFSEDENPISQVAQVASFNYFH